MIRIISVATYLKRIKWTKEDPGRLTKGTSRAAAGPGRFSESEQVRAAMLANERYPTHQAIPEKERLPFADERVKYLARWIKKNSVSQ
jgi:hypothetical protein